MKTKQISAIFLGVLLAVFLFSSCAKDEKADNTKDVNLASDEAMSDKMFSDVQDIVDEAINASLKSTEDDTIFMGPCVTKTIDTIGFPHTVTVDFGLTNCLCADGKYRRGKIISTFTGRYRIAGTVITHTFDNYFVNDNQLLGTRTVTNNGLNNNGNMTWTVHVDGQVIKANNAGTITRIADRVREWTEGSETPHRKRDDLYLTTGTSTVTNEEGLTHTSTITKALEKHMDCRWISSGTVEIQRTEKPLKVLDYGNGECDDLATVTINGETKTIHLR
jgi:hypothetical protein